jgi:hypothetical protein
MEETPMATTATILAPSKQRIERSVPKSKPSSRTRPATASATLSYAQFERLSVINQIRRASMPGARLAAFVGFVIGGFVPVASWTLIHFEVATKPQLWLLVAGGLVYSAITVFKWAKAAFGCPFKAAGFCVLLEGILTFSSIHILSLAALTILIFINAVAAACALQVRKEIA